MIGNQMRRIIGAALAGAFVSAISVGATAETRWQNHHPRRVEVNHRLNNLNRRIAEERREGELTRGQATAEHRQVHQIRKEERAMARVNGSHLTRADQRALNQQENAVSGQHGK
jgi:hypothetical protein